MKHCENCGRQNPDTDLFCVECGQDLEQEKKTQGGFGEYNFQGRYVITETIKSGTSGISYKALDTKFDIAVVIRKIEIGINSSEDKDLHTPEEAFRQEAEILAELHHPRLPKIMDYFTAANEMGILSGYLVMTFIDGEDLESLLIKKPAPLPFDEAMYIFAQLLDIQEYLHSRVPALVLGELKLSDIIFSEGRVYLAGFGAIHPVRLSNEKSAYIYRTDGIDSPADDIFSLGSLMYYLLTGQNPVKQEISVLKPLNQQNPHVPENVSRAVISMLDPETSNRPGSIEEIRGLLRINGNELAVNTTLAVDQALVNPRAEESPKYNRSGKYSILIGILLAFSAIILYISTFTGYFKDTPQENPPTMIPGESDGVIRTSGEAGKNPDISVIKNMFEAVGNSDSKKISDSLNQMPQSVPTIDEKNMPASPEAQKIREATINMYICVVNGDKENLIKLLKEDVAEKIRKNKEPEDIGDIGAVYSVTKMISEKKATIKFKNLKAEIRYYSGNEAEVTVTGTAAATIKDNENMQTNDDQPVNDRIFLEKENGKWKVVNIQGIPSERKERE